MNYYVYLLRCNDQSLYCGYTNDLTRRVDEHNKSRRGARYTKLKRPVELVYFEKFENKSTAMKRECEIKKLGKIKKEELVRGFVSS